MKIVKFIFCMLTLAFSSMSLADDWSGAHEISTIRIYSTDMVLVTMDSFSNSASCLRTDYIELRNADTEAGKRQYSALLAAYTSKQKVNLSFSGCSGGGQNGWPVIDNVWLQ